MGATLSLVCILFPHVDQTVRLQWMQERLGGPGVNCDFNWHLIFDTDGPLEHAQKVAQSTAVTLRPGGMLQGIQRGAPAFGAGVRWPPGDYALDVRGWANRSIGEASCNTETTISLRLSDHDAEWVAKWRNAADKMWIVAKPMD